MGSWWNPRLDGQPQTIRDPSPNSYPNIQMFADEEAPKSKSLGDVEKQR